MQRFQRRDPGRQQANACRERAALVVEVGAEPADRASHEAEIQGLVSLQFFRLFDGEQREQNAANLFRSERLAGGQREIAVDAEGRGRTGDENHVRSEALGCEEQSWSIEDRSIVDRSAMGRSGEVPSPVLFAGAERLSSSTRRDSSLS